MHFTLENGEVLITTISIVVAMLGGSTLIGTEIPYNGTAIPAGITYEQNGVVKTTLPWLDSGPQSGLFTCLYDLGYSVTVVERSAASINASVLQTKAALLITDLAALGVEPDVVIMTHGGNDAKSVTTATNYGNRVFGPWWDLGPGSTDSSVVGQLRRNYGTDMSLVVSTLPNHNGQNLWLNVPETGTTYWHATVRAQQLIGCDRDINCMASITDPNIVELAADQEHPTSLGYWNMGWEMCAAVDQMVQ